MRILPMIALAALAVLACSGTAAGQADTGESSVDALVEALKESDPASRIGAAEKLGQLGPKASSSVRALAESCRDGHCGVREAAAWALGEIGVASKPVVAALTAAFQDDFWLVRETALKAVGKLGKDASEAVPHLEKVLSGERGECRVQAAEALARMGPKGAQILGEQLRLDEALEAFEGSGKDGVNVLLAKAQSKDAKECLRALQALGSLGEEAKRAASRLKGCLRHADPGIRIQALLSLYRITGTEKYLRLACQFLRDKNLVVARTCANLLGDLGPQGKDAVPDLLSAMKTSDAGLFRCAGNALVRIGPDKEILDAVLDGLENPNTEIRDGAVWLLGLCGPAAEPGVPILAQIIKVLKKEDRSFVRQAIGVLERIGPGAREAAPMLVDLWAGEGISDLQMASEKALVSIGAGAAAPLVDQLRSGKKSEERILEMLLAIGPGAECALPVLFERAKDMMGCTNPPLAAYAACRIAPEDEAAFSVLMKYLKDFRFRFNIMSALAKYGLPEKRADEVLPLLVEDLVEKKGRDIALSIAFIGSFGARARTAVPLLIMTLKEPSTRLVTVEALGKIGPEAKEALPALLEAAAERNVAEVRARYREALLKIRGR